MGGHDDLEAVAPHFLCQPYPDLVAELRSIEGQDEEINDRFYRELAFGTGGLRGVLGAGCNRMNIYTVRRTTQGLADYLKQHYADSTVAISYDSRIKSDVFARESARLLASCGIGVYLMEELEPTPVLSYAVRALGCQAGIMVTASHNPAKYNGYKCYGADGGQMTEKAAGEVMDCIGRHELFEDVTMPTLDEAVKNGAVKLIGQDFVEQFLDRVQKEQINPGVCEKAGLSVIYTPLNGTGNKPVRRILQRIGVADVTVVPEQEYPDGRFPTAPYPNPEIRQSFECALALAKKKPADLLLATDPDCDRVGIAVRKGDDYQLMTGNEVGCLMLHYILSSRKAAGTLPENPVAVSTVVSSRLTQAIADRFGCEMRYVLTGFKYIGEQITKLAEAGAPERYQLGFEESYGYLVGDYARDKDAVVGSMLICEMASYYKLQGKTLLDVMEDLYREFGVYQHSMLNVAFEGEKGMKAMQALMARLREQPPVEIAGLPVQRVSDYGRSVSIDCRTGARTEITLPKSDVLVFELPDSASVIIRPSGTEPKVKAYLTATGASRDEATELTEQLKRAADALIRGE
ncbi:MAG: phospho-sugar mutase [Clostridia bacterium]|nr:phospho-sugar mutase [Clostridia bacterium]